MNVDQIIEALALPPESRVDKRVPKKLLIENGAPTVADRRQIHLTQMKKHPNQTQNGSEKGQDFL